MPTRLDTNFPRLKSDDEFEQLICDLCRLEWHDPNTDRRGRSGQKQLGVDVYGQPSDAGGNYRAAQCKLRKTDKQPTENEIEKEVASARMFPHQLDILIITTDAPRDSNTQDIVNSISEREHSNGEFKVAIWFWDSICERIASHNHLIVKYYRDFYSNLTTLPLIENLADTPIQILYEHFGKVNGGIGIEEALILRGIQLVQKDILKRRKDMDIPVDGVLFEYDIHSSSNLLPLAQQIGNHLGKEYPVLVITNAEYVGYLQETIKQSGNDPDQIYFFSLGIQINKLIKDIFEVIFNYGYKRRGCLATIDISVRSSATCPLSALLDLDWQSRLSPNKIPRPSEWNDFLSPAIKDVFSLIGQQGDNTRIQFRPTLPLPAAFAWGYVFNVRVSRVGVWARETTVSDFKRQFWLSDNTANDFVLNRQWMASTRKKCKAVIVELTNGPDIHEAVSEFTDRNNIPHDGWLQLGEGNNDPRMENIDEGTAIAYANQVGKYTREVLQIGVTDFYLFMKMPSALALLVGQRLQACGRLHLYWFDNPSYQYAFTLS